MNDLKFFLALSKPDRWWLRLGAALAALTVLAGIGLLSLSGWFITAAAVAGLAGASRSFNYMFASGGVRAFALSRTLLRYAERMITHEATFRVLARLRLFIFDTAAPLAPGRLSSLRSGDVLARVTQDVDALDNLYLRLMTPLVSAGLGVLVTGVILAVFAPAALPGVIGVFALSGLVLPLVAARSGQSAGETVAQASATARAEAGDLASGLAELNAYGAQKRVISRLDQASKDWVDGQRKLAQISFFNTAILGLAGPGSFVLGFGLAAWSGAPPELSALAGFVAFALFEAAAPLVQAGEVYSKTVASARRLRELTELDPVTRDPDTPEPRPVGWALEAEGLTFTYPGTTMPALTDLQLHLPEGGRLALVGGSGSGKSTLIKLLMRFYAPQSGQLSLGGTALSTLSARAIRSRFALVDQRAELLSTTVRANLRLAKPDASEAQVWDALERARAAEFVRAMPDGLTTWIGEQGGLVSGGQGRRLALARAFLKDAPVLLLDEPTEGLDRETEADFLTALDDWLAEDPRRSVLMVTHRATLLERARDVIVLDQGRVVEAGEIAQLRGSGGRLDRLFPL